MSGTSSYSTILLVCQVWTANPLLILAQLCGICYTVSMQIDPLQSWELIGHAPVLAFLDRVLERDCVSESYIFGGPQSVGKATVARAFAARLLQTRPQQLGLHPDFIVLQRGISKTTKKQREQIGVEQIQAARAQFSKSALHGGYKVLLIEDAHLLSRSAANALLKTLEEPSGRACLLLTTTDRTRLLPTIRSRAQYIALHLVPREVICEALVDRVSREDAHRFAGLAAGSPGVAIQLAEDTELREQILARHTAADACLDGGLHKRILAARELLPPYEEDHVKTRTELLRRLDALEGRARDALLTHVHCADLAVEARQTSMSHKQLTGLLRGLPQLRVQLQHHLNPKLALIQFMLRV